jgi:hypothetical protein
MKETKTIVMVFVILFLSSVVAVVTISFPSSKKPITPEYQAILNNVKGNFSLIHPSLVKIPLSMDSSAYTEDKRRIALCLENPETKRPYDMNTIMYVSLHELAHILNKGFGHGDDFKKIFSGLLKKSSQLGFYDPKIPLPSVYCGVH